MKRIIKITDAVLAVVCAVIMLLVAIGNYALPDEVITYEGDNGRLNSLYSYSTTAAVRFVDYQSSNAQSRTIRLLKAIPVKTAAVKHQRRPQVQVSGEAFGIKLYTDGVIVVGTQSVDVDGKKVNPAAQAGIEVGDVIVAINRTEVYSSSAVSEILNDNNGKPYTLKIKRDGRYKTFTLTPVFSPREGEYKAGMWVRDSTAGIGTITFYNEQSGTFAALGHPVNDVDTNEPMPLLEGEAVTAAVTAVQKPSGSSVGSLCCDFEDNTIGVLTDNTASGLYGAFAAIGDSAVAMPVAARQEVKKGKAQIRTTTNGKTPVYYDVEITHISYNRADEQKDIVFKVTDKALLEQTGGIVQGMSGSPLMQDGRLVGAVTHVIVNNPQKGYAVFAQTMLEASDKAG